MGEVGLPDLQVLAPKRGWLEVKTPGGRLSAEQELAHHRLRDAGWDVAVVRSVTEALDAVAGWQRYGVAG